MRGREKFSDVFGEGGERQKKVGSVEKQKEFRMGMRIRSAALLKVREWMLPSCLFYIHTPFLYEN